MHVSLRRLFLTPAHPFFFFFFFNDTATTEIYTLSLHDALPIWIALVRVHVHAREALAHELVGDDVALRVKRRLDLVDRGRALRIPAMAFVAHALHPHRPPDLARQHRRVHGGVAGIVAAIRAWTHHPDRAHLLKRQLQEVRKAFADEVRLLRAGPDRRMIGLGVDDGAGGSHGRVRLERPFVFRLDDLGRPGPGLVDIALVDVDLLLGDLRLADVLIEAVLVRERRRRIRPFHLQRLGGANRVPFGPGDQAEIIALVDDADTLDVAGAGLLGRDRRGARDRRAGHPAGRPCPDL